MTMPKDVSYGGGKKGDEEKNRIRDMAAGKMEKSYSNEFFRAVDNFLFEFGLMPGSVRADKTKTKDE